MKASYSYTLRRLRGQIVGWGLAFAAMGLMVMATYEMVLGHAEQFTEILESLPPAISIFVGDASQFASPSGWLQAKFFSMMPVIFGVFAILAGAGLLAADEESGWLDLILAYPLSRFALFAGRLLALMTATAGILVFAWLGLAIGLPASPMDVSPFVLLLPLLSLLAVTLVSATLAVLLSLLLPSRRTAAMTAGLLLLGSFMVANLARMNDSLNAIARLLPLSYYQGGTAMDGFHAGWFTGLIVLAAAQSAVAYWLFEKRDVRVSGEGSLDLKKLFAGKPDPTQPGC